ncbi:MAG TPA: sigma-70 family RNA polymerase sigma factor [Kofleriaceae bacterium]|nr:sigma-70 family RNA polymerase sigma factor [Kofleriaceae bacterium]
MSVALALRLDMPVLPAVREQAGQATAQRDAGLVARYLAGDRRAFDELVRHYQKPIYHLAYRYLKSEADAKDLTQRTFIKVFGALPRFRAESSFRTWIYRIAINLCLNELRDRRRGEVSDRPEAIEQAPAPPPDLESLDAQARGAWLRRAIAGLPPKQRMVLELRIYDELPFREVAELVGSSENAAKVNFHHAVKRLRALVEGGGA